MVEIPLVVYQILWFRYTGCCGWVASIWRARADEEPCCSDTKNGTPKNPMHSQNSTLQHDIFQKSQYLRLKKLLTLKAQFKPYGCCENRRAIIGSSATTC